MEPAHPNDLRAGGWPAALGWGLAFSLWAFALIGVVVAGVSTWSTWRHVVEGYERDAVTILSDDMFPDVAPAPLRSAADVAEGVSSANRAYGAQLATYGVGAAILLALAFAYRRWVPPRSRPTRRVWIVVVPLMIVLGAATLFLFCIAVAGAIKG